MTTVKFYCANKTCRRPIQFDTHDSAAPIVTPHTNRLTRWIGELRAGIREEAQGEGELTVLFVECPQCHTVNRIHVPIERPGEEGEVHHVHAPTKTNLRGKAAHHASVVETGQIVTTAAPPNGLVKKPKPAFSERGFMGKHRTGTGIAKWRRGRGER